MCKPSSLIIASRTVRPKWPRYGNLLEVVDGNWMLPGSRQNHEVLEETRPLDARHGPLVCGYALVSANLVPSYGLKLHCFVDGEGNSIIKPTLPCGHTHLWERLRKETLRINQVWDLQCPSCASRKGHIPDAKGEVILTEILSAEVGGAGP